MKLVDADILAARAKGEIVITPWDDESLGTNSYDVHLSQHLKVYHMFDPEGYRINYIDCRRPTPCRSITIPPEGFVMHPGELYLGSTVEYTESNAHVPHINGKSSVGRLGLHVHATAGTGDVGFRGHWTLEMYVVGHALKVYADMPIAQLLWDFTWQPPLVPYSEKPGRKYGGDHNPEPVASQMHRNFKPDR